MPIVRPNNNDIIALHDERSGESHAPEDSALVGLEDLPKRHVVLGIVSFGCVRDDLFVDGEVVVLGDDDRRVGVDVCVRGHVGREVVGVRLGDRCSRSYVVVLVGSCGIS
jgi:hypothetical protein